MSQLKTLPTNPRLTTALETIAKADENSRYPGRLIIFTAKLIQHKIAIPKNIFDVIKKPTFLAELAKHITSKGVGVVGNIISSNENNFDLRYYPEILNVIEDYIKTCDIIPESYYDEYYGEHEDNYNNIPVCSGLASHLTSALAELLLSTRKYYSEEFAERLLTSSLYYGLHYYFGAVNLGLNPDSSILTSKALVDAFHSELRDVINCLLKQGKIDESQLPQSLTDILLKGYIKANRSSTHDFRKDPMGPGDNEPGDYEDIEDKFDRNL